MAVEVGVAVGVGMAVAVAVGALVGKVQADRMKVNKRITDNIFEIFIRPPVMKNRYEIILAFPKHRVPHAFLKDDEEPSTAKSKINLRGVYCITLL